MSLRPVNTPSKGPAPGAQGLAVAAPGLRALDRARANEALRDGAGRPRRTRRRPGRGWRSAITCCTSARRREAAPELDAAQRQFESTERPRRPHPGRHRVGALPVARGPLRRVAGAGAAAARRGPAACCSTSSAACCSTPSPAAIRRKGTRSRPSPTCTRRCATRARRTGAASTPCCIATSRTSCCRLGDYHEALRYLDQGISRCQRV